MNVKFVFIDVWHKSAAHICKIMEAEFFCETTKYIYHNKHITCQVTVIFIITTRIISNITTISLQICTNILHYKATI